MAWSVRVSAEDVHSGALDASPTERGDQQMYGTIARLRVKEGKLEDAREVMLRWDRERRPKVPGFVAGHTLQLDGDPRAVILVAVFDSKESYRANAEDPEQDRWYRQLRELLDADPVWQDGQVIASY
jgi:quinol monooxygenase YgiN